MSSACPAGPKTLCNACGVKRTRRIKAEEEGTTAKRRKLSASPAPPAHKLAVAAPKRSRTLYAQGTVLGAMGQLLSLPHAACACRGTSRRIHWSSLAWISTCSQRRSFRPLCAADGPSMDRYGSLEPDSDAWAPLGTQGSGRRPTRRAAEEAAFKTALYARTGECSAAGWLDNQAFLQHGRVRPLAHLQHLRPCPASVSTTFASSLPLLLSPLALLTHSCLSVCAAQGNGARARMARPLATC